MQENRWKLCGKPANSKKKKGGGTKLGRDFQAFQASTFDPKQQSSSDSVPFSKEQIVHRYKMFQTHSIGNPSSSSSTVQSGNLSLLSQLMLILMVPGF